MIATIFNRPEWMVLTIVACLSLPLARSQAETVEWIGQLGTRRHEDSLGVSADGLGNVYISGGTEGSLGRVNAGFGDAFVVKISDRTVPEPTTWVLLVLVGLSFSCRRGRI